MTFEAMFQRATGRDPYPYQVRLATAPVLPDLLTVPTGCGKTAAVVLGWLWRRRFAGDELRAATPRRLVYTLPVRTLVEQTAGEARRWLAEAGAADVSIHAMLGGAIDESWQGRPEVDSIIIGTQDQLLSRALMRGYAMSPFRWPVHFALLHNDAWWVYDETQLMGPGLSTAAQLEGLRRALGTALPCRSTWMSATNARGRLATVDLRAYPLQELGLDAADREHPELHRRLASSKSLVQLADPDALAAEAASRHSEGTRTLVVVNRVARAISVFQDIVKQFKKAGRAVPVRLVHSRFRPGDRAQQQSDALAPDFSGVVVATQAIEAGVDITSATLITEMAPWSSLVQRFGRNNRGGELPPGGATVVVVDVPDKMASPYAPDQLADSRRRLAALTDVGLRAIGGLSDPPAEAALPVLRRRDLLELFDTEPDIAGRHLDIAHFVRDTSDRDIQLAWRDLGDAPPAADSPALARDELCRVRIEDAQALLREQKAWRWDPHLGAWEAVPTRFGKLDIVPGQALLVDVAVGGYDQKLGFTRDSKHRPAPIRPFAPRDDDEDDRKAVEFGQFVSLSEHSSDVAEEMAALAQALGPGPWPLLVTAARWHDLGKVHAAFQAVLVASLAPDDPRRAQGPWAKSDGKRGARPDGARRFFRHELASALGLLAQGGDDLAAYLVAAHHGKVRVRLRSRPTERAPADRPGVHPILGVCHGDVLPAANLGGAVTSCEVSLSTEVAALGAPGGSWSDRVLRLLEEHGPFQLAWWEALVRIADWRGSARRNPNLKESS